MEQVPSTYLETSTGRSAFFLPERSKEVQLFSGQQADQLTKVITWSDPSKQDQPLNRRGITNTTKME